jgi:hypothetical protein
MTPEMQLAQALGGLPSTGMKKLAHTLEHLSIEELEQVLKSESLEKVALSGRLVGRSAALRLSQAAGGGGRLPTGSAGRLAVAKVNKEHPIYEKWVSKRPQKASGMASGIESVVKDYAAKKGVSGKLAKEMKSPRYQEAKRKSIESIQSFAKRASKESLEWADVRGREIAHANKVMGTGAVGRAAVGAGVGAAGGLASSVGNPNADSGSRVLGGAAVGAGLGLGARPLVGMVGRSSRNLSGGMVKAVNKDTSKGTAAAVRNVRRGFLGGAVKGAPDAMKEMKGKALDKARGQLRTDKTELAGLKVKKKK